MIFYCDGCNTVTKINSAEDENIKITKNEEVLKIYFRCKTCNEWFLIVENSKQDIFLKDENRLPV
jgi:hypothetical protein